MATPIPQNRARFTLAEIAAETGGTLTGPSEASVRGVATDSREDLAGKLFVALRGEHFDGHRFVVDAVRRGASAVLVEAGSELDVGVPLIRAADTLSALGALARHHREKWGGPVVAIAGSAGKTTTRSACTTLLESVHPGAVHRGHGNLNNRIGVPMVLLGLEKDHRVAVVEIGTNLRGEVALLSGIAKPDIGVLTLIDLEHTAGIGTLDDVEAEEGDLLAAVRSTGEAIANGDDPRVSRQLERAAAARRIRYGFGGRCDYRILSRGETSFGRQRVTIERVGASGRETLELHASLLGAPGALSLTAAVAVCDAVNGAPVSAEALARAAELPMGEPGRLSPTELADGTLILDDTYNANPASVEASIETAMEFGRARGARVLLVLGEMRELGEQSGAQHDRVASFAARSGASVLVAIAGDAARFVAQAVRSGLDSVFTETSEAALAEVSRRLLPGDVVLVKASRGVRAERVVEGLTRDRGRQP